MAMFETLVQLFAAFAKIGFTSFGGTSMIPLIMDEMSSHGWMTDADLTNLIAIGILCFVLLQKFKLSVPKVIGIAAVLGLVCFGVF